MCGKESPTRGPADSRIAAEAATLASDVALLQQACSSNAGRGSSLPLRGLPSLVTHGAVTYADRRFCTPRGGRWFRRRAELSRQCPFCPRPSCSPDARLATVFARPSPVRPRPTSVSRWGSTLNLSQSAIGLRTPAFRASQSSRAARSGLSGKGLVRPWCRRTTPSARKTQSRALAPARTRTGSCGSRQGFPRLYERDPMGARPGKWVNPPALFCRGRGL